MAPATSVEDWFLVAEFPICKAYLHAVGKNEVEKKQSLQNSSRQNC